MRISDEQRYFDRFWFRDRRLRLLLASLAVMVSFSFGVFYGQNIPRTFFSRPLATLRIMQAYPVGSKVFPVNRPDVREHFEELGWGTEPAVIVGYEIITFEEKEVMVCHVRTKGGAGYILPVNPDWIERVQEVGRNADHALITRRFPSSSQ
jgi:hypothetical protein